MSSPAATLFDMIEVYGRPAKTDAQGRPKPASVRNAIGEVAAEFACRALDLESVPIDGREAVCHDAKYPDGSPAEIKSVGKNNRALLYKWRVEKELAHHGPEYRYIFVCHTAPITLAHGADVADYFRDHPPRILTTTLAAILSHAIKDTPARTFRLFTGEKGGPVPDQAQPPPPRPEPEPLPKAGGGWEYARGGWFRSYQRKPIAPAKPKFDRHTQHGTQRAGYVEGGWQFSLRAIPRKATERVTLKWRGQEITVDVERG